MDNITAVYRGIDGDLIEYNYGYDNLHRLISENKMVDPDPVGPPLPVYQNYFNTFAGPQAHAVSSSDDVQNNRKSFERWGTALEG